MKKIFLLCLASLLLPVQSVFAQSENTSIRYLTDRQIDMSVDVEADLNLKELFKKFPKNVKIREQVSDYEVISTYSDGLDLTHYIIAPVIDDKIVHEYMLLVHVDEYGKLTSVNGELDREPLYITNTNRITEDLAIEFALDYLKLTPELTDYQIDRDFAVYSTYKIDTERMKRVYNIQVDTYEDFKEFEVIVDAENGDILDSRTVSSGREKKYFTAKGTGAFGDEYPLVATTINGVTYLFGQVGNTPLTTFEMNADTLGFKTAYDPDGIFNDPSQAATVQTHYNMQQVINYFTDEFGWESYDGYASPVEVVVNYTDNGDDLDNAMWDGYRFVFGSGDKELSHHNGIALDIVAHEYMHAITENTAGLVYENQSGAIDESLSDMFGYFVSPENYLIGEDLLREGADETLVMRSLEDPEKYGQPAHMKDFMELENNLDGDYGGVHYNSGIANKAGYLLIKEVGDEAASLIYYYAVQHYLFPYSEFSDARIALYLSAEILYGVDSDEAKAVLKAWDAVGVSE